LAGIWGVAVEPLTPLLPLMGGSELKRMLDAENEPATASTAGLYYRGLLARKNWPT